MVPLLEIKTIPISIEFKTSSAKVERVSGQADLEITRDKHGLTMKSRPIKVNIDTFEARNSVIPSLGTSIANAAKQGQQAAYEATARFAEEGYMMMNIGKFKDPISQISESRLNPTCQYSITFSPEYPAEISWEPNELSIQYEMDKLNFDWQNMQGSFEFTPASIEFTVKEYPRVVFEYIGSPIYVPPSSDPNYVPVDIQV